MRPKQQNTEPIYIFGTKKELDQAVKEGKLQKGDQYRIDARYKYPAILENGKVRQAEDSDWAAREPEEVVLPEPPQFVAPPPVPQPQVVPVQQQPKAQMVVQIRKPGFWAKMFGPKQEPRFLRLRIQGMKCYKCQIPKSEWGDQIEGKTICAQCKADIEALSSVR